MKSGWYEDECGILKHYVNDKLHNEKGSTEIGNNGFRYWKQNDKFHRIDGPAVEYCKENKYWYYQGKLIALRRSQERTSQEKFERIIKVNYYYVEIMKNG